MADATGTPETESEAAPELTATGSVKKQRVPKRAVLVGARIVAGTVGIAVAAATILAATYLPLPGIRSDAPSALVMPVPTAQQRVCPGGLLRLGDEAGKDATTATSIGSATTRYRSTAGSVDTALLETPDGAGSAAQAGPLLISAAPAEADAGTAVLLAGAQSQVAATGDFVGFAATECAGASTGSWLVGGSSVVGRTTLLTLANPTDVVAEVSFELFGEEGQVNAPGSTGIVVQPRSQRVLPLAAFAPGLVSPVIHVTSEGGQVVATVQQSTVRGLTPGGVDLVGATAIPANRQVIPGLVVRDVAELEGRLAEAGYNDLATVLRVYNPGETTTAQVAIVSEDGVTPGASFSTEIEGGLVTDIPVDGLLDGSYTVSVSADSAIVAGLRTSTIRPEAEGGEADFAWLAAASKLSRDALVSIVDGPGALMHLSNPSAESVQVTLTPSSGTATTVSVAARSSAVVPVDPGRAYRLSGFDALYSSVSFADAGRLAGYVVQPPALASGELRVYP